MFILDYVFFFSSRRRHTRLQGDWSSDVCSSDLNGRVGDFVIHVDRPIAAFAPRAASKMWPAARGQNPLGAAQHYTQSAALQIGRASCRERVWSTLVDESI